jgi:hypothetical protein
VRFKNSAPHLTWGLYTFSKHRLRELTQAPPPSVIKQLHSLEIEMEETLCEKDDIVSTLRERVACGIVRRCYHGHAFAGPINARGRHKAEAEAAIMNHEGPEEGATVAAKLQRS